MKDVADNLAGAQWIWAADTAPNGYVHARRRFTLPCVPENATLAVTADSRYAVWLNGREVGRGRVCSVGPVSASIPLTWPGF